MILKKILPLTMVATGFLTAEAPEKPIIKISTDDTEMVIDVMMQLYSSGEARLDMGVTTYFQTRLKGLDPDKQYRVTEINKKDWPKFYGDGQVFPGDYLMNEGISLNINNNFDSTVLHLEEI